MLNEKGTVAYKSRSTTGDGRRDQRRFNLFTERIIPGDVVVNWGHSIPLAPRTGVRFLNQPNRDYGKRDQLIQFAVAGIGCPEVFNTPGAGRIGRRHGHVGGNDLLTVQPRYDYWTQKLNLVQEVRVHVFNGVSIRAGVKVPRIGMTPHPWVRSYDGGWMIQYGHPNVRQVHRDVAKNAIKALDLDFGAVDIGVTDAGRIAVLEVNLAPGIEGGTVEAYARHIRECTG
jgi:hypothetical protein